MPPSKTKSECMCGKSITRIERTKNLSIPIGKSDSSSFESCSQVSILSWNILAQCLFEKNISEYSHVYAESSKSWTRRKSLILAELTESNPSIICLQEVEPRAFHEDILPDLRSKGYHGILKNDRKKGNGNSVFSHGVATFWKCDRYCISQVSHRSRSLLTILNDITESDTGRKNTKNQCLLAIVNVHLEGHPMKSMSRLKQLCSTLHELSTNYSHHALIICGDFNCQLQSSACGAYLSFGSCPNGILEWGHPVQGNIASIPSHSYNLSSLYGGVNDFTYAQYPGHPVHGLDQIWYTTESLCCVALRELFHSEEQRIKIVQEGLPSELNPSDHIPIGAVFHFFNGDKKQQPVDLKIVPPSSRNSIDNVDDPLLEAQLLLDACPFDKDSQREEFIFITSDIPGLTKRCRPSKEQMEMIKERRERKVNLLSEVSDEVHQMLDRVLKLRKEGKKNQVKVRMNA